VYLQGDCLRGQTPHIEDVVVAAAVVPVDVLVTVAVFV
jgi:hypothetical protein